ncbi:MAG: integration host factor subunit alpha [Deltaproteobacteria bacterium]|nr:integration host factor subunit alpha [Deltaproteobacteria bacterium]
MTKAELTEVLINKTGFSKRECSDSVDQIFELIKSALESGEQVKISGLGTFTVKTKNPRRGRNPQTGDEMLLESRKVLTFKISPVLKQHMNAE